MKNYFHAIIDRYNNIYIGIYVFLNHFVTINFYAIFENNRC